MVVIVIFVVVVVILIVVLIIVIVVCIIVFYLLLLTIMSSLWSSVVLDKYKFLQIHILRSLCEEILYFSRIGMIF